MRRGRTQIDGRSGDLPGKQLGHITFTAPAAGSKVTRVFHDCDVFVAGVGLSPISDVMRQHPLWGECDVIRVVIVVNGRKVDVPETAGFQAVFFGNQLTDD